MAFIQILTDESIPNCFFLIQTRPMSGDNLRLDFTSRGGAGAPTLTTPTLTPTTLRNIEQVGFVLYSESKKILFLINSQ